MIAPKLMPNASLQLLPEAGAERSKAEAGGSQLQGVVRQGTMSSPFFRTLLRRMAAVGSALRSFWHRGDESAQHGIHRSRSGKHLRDIGVQNHHEMSSLTSECKTIRTGFPIIKVVLGKHVVLFPTVSFRGWCVVHSLAVPFVWRGGH